MEKDELSMERTVSTTKERKKGLILQAMLERCRSLIASRRRSPPSASMSKSRSWPRSRSAAARPQIAPGGYVAVYVGPCKERFVIKTECVNHHLFRPLLDEAETEYGFASKGPLELPCDVEHFQEVLCDMAQGTAAASPIRCSFHRTYSAYHQLLSPPRHAIAAPH